MTSLEIKMGESPHYIIKKFNENTQKMEKVGAAWNREKGGFSISIGQRGEEVKYIAYPNDYEAKRANPATAQQAIKEKVQESFIDDEVPF